MYKFLISFTLLAFLSGCSSHYYYDEARSYSDGITEVLVSNKKCESTQKCKLLFWSSGALVFNSMPFYGGVNISIYEVSEPSIVASIISFCIKNHENHQGVKTTVKIYSTPHLSDDENIIAELNL